MTIFKGAMFGIGLFFVVLILVLIALVMLEVAVYINTKDDTLKKISMEQRAVNSAAIMRMVDDVINSILLNKRELQLQMRTPFAVLNLDKDAAALATQVKRSLSPELFTTTNEFIFTAEYLETYIVESLTEKMIEVYKETNAEIARMNAV